VLPHIVITFNLGTRQSARAGKNRQALPAGNVEQLQEIRLNEDLLLKM
jgi:hypothetical protein